MNDLPESHTDTLMANTFAAVTISADHPIVPRPIATQPTKIGRFTVVRELGSGGMGVVYAAYDEQLDRRVAIKLLHNDPGLDSTQGHARLLREAQALARLSHPHVVGVYEVGSFFDQVFLAMEYVHGQSLREWLAAKPRPWREVLRVFVEAGRGLAAAHAAGLVHRDFKPDNAIVGDDGRVRVLDFGLARAPEPTQAAAVEEARTTASRNTLSSQLTVVGAVVGTPAYIAPELYMRQPADARSDQFAFCVALWEGLYGERPFRGESMNQLALAICDGTLSPPPAGRRVPAWLHAALVRGLDVDPARRWASMEALLAAIDRDPDRARVRLLGGGVLLCLVALLGLGARSLLVTRDEQCTGGAAEIAGTWGHDAKASLDAAIVASGLPYARDVADRVGARLDAYAAAWSAAHRDACEDTAVRKQQSQELLELRMACLDGRRRALASTIELLREADAGVLERAVQAVDGLPAIELCESVSYVRAEHPLPATAAAAIADAAARERLERTEALLRAGRAHEADVILTAAEQHEVPPHLAPEQLLLRARVDAARSRYATSRAALERAYLLARRNGDDAAARDAALRMISALNDAHPLRDLLLLWDRLAEMEVERSGSKRNRLELRLARSSYLRLNAEFQAARDVLLGAPEECEADPDCWNSELSANLMGGLGLVYESLGDGTRALELHRRAYDRRVEMFGPRHPTVAMSLDSTAGALSLLGRADEALAAAEQALALRVAAYGPDHTRVADSYNNVAIALMDLQEVSRAIEYLRETARIEAKLFGEDSTRITVTYMNLGGALHSIDRHEEALEILQHAEKVQRATLAPFHADMLVTLSLLGGVEHSLGDFAASERYYREAMQVVERRLEPGHMLGAKARQNFATLLWARGRSREALELLAPMRAELEQTLGPDHVYLAVFDTTLALIEAAEGLTVAAEARFRDALARFDRLTPAEDVQRIDAMVGLATVILPRDPAQALALADGAEKLAKGEQLAMTVLAPMHEVMALALLRTGGDRERAMRSPCIVDKSLLPYNRNAPAIRKRLRGLGLLTASCR